MKILVDDNIPYLRGRLEAVADVEYVDQFGFTPENVRDADALVIRTRTRCNRELLEGSNVSLIATATIGMDQIDLPWCADAGIEVSNAPGCNAPAVAQYVWSSLLRTGFDPSRGDTLGVVGCGNVGGIVAAWGRQLGARVLVSDPPRQRAGIVDDYLPLDQLLRESDAVTLHTPLTRTGEDATHHLIGESELTQMRPGTIFINAARGPVVDFKALRRHMGRTPAESRLKAVIDTWEGEPEVDHEVLAGVIYGTFHIAGYSSQGKQRATRMAIEAIERKFGVAVDKSGLEGKYTGTPGLTPQLIVDSYDPGIDSEALKSAPDHFDTLRRHYDYRPEVGM